MRKKCSKCDKYKSHSNFYPDKTSKDGLRSWCSLCERIRHQQTKHTVSKRMSRYKDNAKRKNIQFSLSPDEFKSITSKPCIYCGGYSESVLSRFCGIDRINSYKGYIKSNVVPCCWRCNDMKGTLTKKQFIQHIRKIYKKANA